MHLDKELRYIDKGIKVLSLFFIDEVKKYRLEDGSKGIYAEMFEECYKQLIKLEKYAPLCKQFPLAVENAHDGYFSQDKKGNYKNTRGDTLDDHTTYNTIMKDKEWLLSFDCPLRFIFSHSALKEGWDNPNVFQVCTLINQKSTFTARQKVGRGLRLCVNQDGERIEDKEINQLHVMANESFAEFASNLQKEIESESGVKFGALQLNLFMGLNYTESKTVEKTITTEQAGEVISILKTFGVIDVSGKLSANIEPSKIEIPQEKAEMKSIVESVLETVSSKPIEQKADNSKVLTPITVENIVGQTYTETITEEKVTSHKDASEIMGHMEQKGYITKIGKITTKGETAIKDGTFSVPERLSAIKERCIDIARTASSKLNISDASRNVTVKLKKQIIESDPIFKAIWEKIEQKTTYRVQIDNDELLKRSIKGLKEMAQLPKARIVTKTANINIQNMGVSHTERELKTIDIQSGYSRLPDFLAIISDSTHVPEKMVGKMIEESGRIVDFIRNPQLFIENCTQIIQEARHTLAIDGIRYIKLLGEKYYALELFDKDEFLANLDKNAIAVNRSVYDYIVYDSESVEKPFAKALDDDPEVKLFLKLPRSFKIETPIGTYNPDWAVYMERNGDEKMYFVIETKGSTSLLDLRAKEELKIKCGKKHFEALGSDIELKVANHWGRFKKEV